MNLFIAGGVLKTGYSSFAKCSYLCIWRKKILLRETYAGNKLKSKKLQIPD